MKDIRCFDFITVDRKVHDWIFKCVYERYAPGKLETMILIGMCVVFMLSAQYGGRFLLLVSAFTVFWLLLRRLSKNALINNVYAGCYNVIKGTLCNGDPDTMIPYFRVMDNTGVVSEQRFYKRNDCSREGDTCLLIECRGRILLLTGMEVGLCD